MVNDNVISVSLDIEVIATINIETHLRDRKFIDKVHIDKIKDIKNYLFYKPLSIK